MITAIVAATLAAVLVIRAAAKPDAFRLRRSTRIEAPPEKIRELIDDFPLWASWSPYEDLDPVMLRAYSEPAAGEGAVYAWKSSGRAGTGRMVITESSPSRVVVHLDRARTHSVARFTLCPANGATLVTWSMEGVGSFLARHLLGRELETGLANLKATVERNWYGPRKPARRAPRRPHRAAIFQPAA
ncbi:MAG TPA: SRPBCC family protein [Thermoanaerobaculia bacterium]